jgi:hypothetical protein
MKDLKELYTFDVKRTVEKEVPYVKKTKDGPVESTKKVKKTIENRMVLVKPSIAQLEDADFFYGQKFNELINAGFLTKAMLSKKMGDIGGMQSKKTEEIMGELISENLEASRTIEFYEGSENLDEEQKKQLEDARERFALSAKGVQTIEADMRSQFNQTAEAKAEQRLIEWIVLNFSYYEDALDDDKKTLFPLFEGENYEEKRAVLLNLQQDIQDIEETSLLKAKNIFDSSYTTFIRAASIWYNKIGENQEDIEKSIKELFTDHEQESLQKS